MASSPKESDIAGFRKSWKDLLHQIFLKRKSLPIKFKKTTLMSRRGADVMLLNAFHLVMKENESLMKSYMDGQSNEELSSSTDFDMEETDEDFPEYLREAEHRWMIIFDDIVKYDIGPYFFGSGETRIDSLHKLLLCAVQLIMEKRLEAIQSLQWELEEMKEENSYQAASQGSSGSAEMQSSTSTNPFLAGLSATTTNVAHTSHNPFTNT